MAVPFLNVKGVIVAMLADVMRNGTLRAVVDFGLSEHLGEEMKKEHQLLNVNLQYLALGSARRLVILTALWSGTETDM